MLSSVRVLPPDFRVAIARRSQTKAGEAEVGVSVKVGGGRGGRARAEGEGAAGKAVRSLLKAVCEDAPFPETPERDVSSAATGGGGELLCSRRQRGCRVEGALALQQEPKKIQTGEWRKVQSEQVVAT